MRARRLVLGTTLAAVAAVAIPTHAAPPPVLDGKKVTKVEWAFETGLQYDGFVDQLGDRNPATCMPPRCQRMDFELKPTKGVTGNVLVKIKWGSASDLDLYLVNSKGEEIAHCGGPNSLGEAIVVPLDKMPAGKYTVVTDQYLALEESVTGLVEFPTAFAGTGAGLDTFGTGMGCAYDGSS